MKKTFYLLSIAALVAAVFASCNKVEEEAAPVDEQPTVESLTFAISGDSDTKAILGESGGKYFGEWENNDKLGSITTKSYGSSTVDATTSPVTFKVYSKGGLTAGNTINVWYPYVASYSDATAVPMSIPTTQYMVGGDFDFSAMPMVAEEITVTDGMVSATDQTTVGIVRFLNLGSLINFRVYTGSSYTTEKIVSVTFNGSAAIAGDFTKNVKTVDADNASSLEISGYTATSVTTNVVPYTSTVGTEANPLDVFMVIAPGSYSGNVVVVTDVATYTWSIPSAQTFNRSGIRTFGLKLDKGTATRVPNVKGSFSFWLNKASYNTMEEEAASWVLSPYLTMAAAKGTAGTNTNNYIPPTNSSTRFYKNSTLTFTPTSFQIEKVEYKATTEGYATAMNNSTWSNATHSVDGTVVTIVPTDGSAAFGATAVGATTGATEVKVFYDNTEYTLSGSCSPAAGGSITIKKGGADVTSAKVNTTITLAETPNSGYSFVSWTVKDASNNDVPMDGNTFVMPASNVTITANYAEAAAAKTITISPTTNGTVTTSPAGSAAPGAIVTITATPDEGYVLASLTVTDEDSGSVTVTSNQFTMPSKNVTIAATFARVYSIVFGSTTNQTAVSSYTTSFNTVSDGITVTCQNFNNNKTGVSGTDTSGSWTYILAGQKKSKAADPDKVTTGTITTASAITSVIEKVVVSLEILRGSATGKLYVASDSGFTAGLQTIDLGSLTTGDKVFSIPAPAANLYYKLEFVCTNTTTSNGVVKVTGIQYSTID